MVPYNGANNLAVVWMQNDGGGVSNIRFNYYNSAALIYTRYDQADVVISNPANNARYPTVEASDDGVGVNVIHVAYIESIAGAWRLMYAARLLMVWSASPAPVDSYGLLAIDSDTGYPSMVVVHNATLGRMEVVVAIQNTDAGANDEIYAYHFTTDMCVGAPTFFAESAVDVYDDFHPNNHPLCAYQLGISQVDEGISTPIFFLYKDVMTAVAQNYDVVLAYSSFPPCTMEPWPTMTIRSGVANFSANNATFIRPKCHYQYAGPRRKWRSSNITPWYPVAHHPRVAKMFAFGAAPILHERVLCVKDVPDYPLTVGVGM
jgi:hypothetical protein